MQKYFGKHLRFNVDIAQFYCFSGCEDRTGCRDSYDTERGPVTSERVAS